MQKVDRIDTETLIKQMDKVKPPISLSERQIKVAKNWVLFNREVGGNVREFCDSQKPFSTATWTKWNLENAFSNYILDLTGEVVTTNELDAYHAVKAKIIEMATAKNAGTKEIELFTTHFKGLIQYQNKQDMVRLGIEEDTGINTETLEERKAALFALRNR